MIRPPFRSWLSLMALLWGGTSLANETGDLATLSIEELLRTEVSSVLKVDGALAEAPAAISVLSREDIVRAGVQTLPDALRLVPGMNVAQIDGNKWAISARGFNGFFSTKLLVLVDGRSIYNSVYSGVFWDAADIPLDNIARIEVVRGPGATLWGVNAVNGVINIVTRNARQTQGGSASVSYGNMDRGTANLRWGDTNDNGVAWRVYSRSRSRDDQPLVGSSTGAGDTTENRLVGFRADSPVTDRDNWMLTGEAYEGRSGGAPAPQATTTRQHGEHLLGRALIHLEGDARLQIQSYIDHSWRKEVESGSVLDETKLDLDLQHIWGLSPQHRLISGGGIRQTRLSTTGSTNPANRLSFIPAASRQNITNLFIQDEWSLIPDQFKLVIGSKYEYSNTGGGAWQPSLRGIWTPNPLHTFWAAASRAVRSPNLMETSIRFTGILDSSNIPKTIRGNPSFSSERMNSLEAGWRAQLSPTLIADLALYHNQYPRLQTGEADAGGVLTYLNNAAGYVRGLELALDWQAAQQWQLRGGITLRNEALHYTEPPSPVGALIAFANSAPQRQGFLRSRWDFGHRETLDLTWRTAAAIPAKGVPGYGSFDLRWARPLSQRSELALTARNLGGPNRREFGDQPFFIETQIRREVFATLRFDF
ncbi:MAG: hypothetical protein RIR00_880 [Pseudomonadota bacterium]|jgi:iron complex outermembrane receptor protein